MGMEGMPERKEVPVEFTPEQVRERYEDANKKAYEMLTDEERAAYENVPTVEEWNREGDDMWTHPVFEAPEYPAYKAAEDKLNQFRKELEARVSTEVGEHGRMMYAEQVEAIKEDKDRTRQARIAAKAAEAGISPEEYIAQRRAEGSKNE